MSRLRLRLSVAPAVVLTAFLSALFFQQGCTPASSTKLTVPRDSHGAVNSTSNKINCSSSVNKCSSSYAAGSSDTFTATAASGYRFIGWSYNPCGTGAQCPISFTTEFVQANPTFTLRANYEAVTPNPDGLNADYRAALWLLRSSGLTKVDAAQGTSLLQALQAAGSNLIAIDDRAGVVWSYGAGQLSSFDFKGQRQRVLTVSTSSPW